jgi:alpha-1,2-mannosyltransferase
VLVALGVLGFGVYPLSSLTLGQPFPGRGLAGPATLTVDCVTSDDPSALVEMGVLSRNLRRGCPFVADLGGYSYELARQRGNWSPRRNDESWQRIYLGYLRSGRLALSFHYRQNGALSASTIRTMNSWPQRSRVGRYVLREPQPGAP